MSEETRVKIQNGKYEFIINDGKISIERFEEPWIENLDCSGSKAIIALVHELEEARKKPKSAYEGGEVLLLDIPPEYMNLFNKIKKEKNWRILDVIANAFSIYKWYKNKKEDGYEVIAQKGYVIEKIIDY